MAEENKVIVCEVCGKPIEYTVTDFEEVSLKKFKRKGDLHYYCFNHYRASRTYYLNGTDGLTLNRIG